MASRRKSKGARCSKCGGLLKLHFKPCSLNRFLEESDEVQKE